MSNENALMLDDKDVLTYGGVKLRKGELSVGYNGSDEVFSVGEGTVETTIYGYGIVANED